MITTWDDESKDIKNIRIFQEWSPKQKNKFVYILPSDIPNQLDVVVHNSEETIICDSAVSKNGGHDFEYILNTQVALGGARIDRFDISKVAVDLGQMPEPALLTDSTFSLFIHGRSIGPDCGPLDHPLPARIEALFPDLTVEGHYVWADSAGSFSGFGWRGRFHEPLWGRGLGDDAWQGGAVLLRDGRAIGWINALERKAEGWRRVSSAFRVMSSLRSAGAWRRIEGAYTPVSLPQTLRAGGDQRGRLVCELGDFILQPEPGLETPGFSLAPDIWFGPIRLLDARSGEVVGEGLLSRAQPWPPPSRD
jgi:hypothetical protein